MKNLCAILCQVSVCFGLVACSSSHGTDGTVDAAIDTGVPVDAEIVTDAGPRSDASGSCPATGVLPVWNATTPCSDVGLTCSSGGTSTCGSFYSCECESTGFWSCAIAEPDPACWCGRYPSVDSECVTEGQQCTNGSSCDESHPALVCHSRRWTVDAAASCGLRECPANVAEAIGTPCDVGGVTCNQALCCTYASPGSTVRSASILCSGSTWIEQAIAVDCIPEMSVCDGFACGSGFCRPDQACVQRCGPTDGVNFSCVSIDGVAPSCDALVERLGVPPSTCHTDGAGNVTVNEGLCG